jgi:hypothetical protein
MKAFVCAGLAIILGLIAIGIYAEHCTTCCNGEPCNPELRAQLLHSPDEDPAR